MDPSVLNKFLVEDRYIDYSSINITLQAEHLFESCMNEPVEIARVAYHYVRDHIMNSFDIAATILSAKASDVLRSGTGICDAKANLLAAFLRKQGIPTGFCYQYLTVDEDELKGYCLHCYNVVYLENRWVMLDARGNNATVHAQFSLDVPKLAYTPRSKMKEYTCKGIYASPHMGIMKELEEAESLEELRQGLAKISELDEPTIVL